MKIRARSLLLTLSFFLFASPAQAVVDPLAVPNNKVGIHIISPTADEASVAAQLVNSSGGDWGYVTVLIENKDRHKDKWQAFFDDLRRRHLIPLVRIATQPEGSFWKVPEDGEANAWAVFLNSLSWPTRNRYVIIYNEPNQGQEWGGRTDPASYAKALDQTAAALKSKSDDFFILNAGFDASAPQKPPLYMDESVFLEQMEAAVSGVFNRLDGWVSHSYPNPGFAGSPEGSGKGTVRTWEWEKPIIDKYTGGKKLPVFITETGWKHAEGRTFDRSLPTADQVAAYFAQSFKEAWSDPSIAAVTPFVLNYQEAPFDHFSFKRITGEKQNLRILGTDTEEPPPFADYYPTFNALMDLSKVSGKPYQIDKAELVKNTVYPALVSGQHYTIPLTYRNIGQTSWNETSPVTLRVISGGQEMGIENIQTLTLDKVGPNQDATFNIYLKPTQYGKISLTLQLYNGDKPFDQIPQGFISEIKPPVILDINAALAWKNNFDGRYFLSILSDAVNNTIEIDLDEKGRTEPIEAKYLLPEYTFTFILQRPFYKAKTIKMTVHSGKNKLDFGSLDPDFGAALKDPPQALKLLPFIN